MFLRAWLSIEPKKLYNPVCSLLLSDKTAWQGMRLTGQIRYEEGLKTPSDPNSTYKVSPRPPRHIYGLNADPFVQDITRTARRFNPLKVPRKLEASLPYATKTHALAPQKKKTYLQSRAVVMSPEEKKAVALLQQIQGLQKDKVARRKAKQEERRAEHRKETGKIDEKKEAKMKEERREKYKKEGLKRKRDEAAAESRGRKKHA